MLKQTDRRSESEALLQKRMDWNQAIIIEIIAEINDLKELKKEINHKLSAIEIELKNISQKMPNQ